LIEKAKVEAVNGQEGKEGCPSPTQGDSLGEEPFETVVWSLLKLPGAVCKERNSEVGQS